MAKRIIIPERMGEPSERLGARNFVEETWVIGL
jgi:hypothetical protein